MRSFQDSLPAFNERGIRVVAVSVDPPETSKAHRTKLDLAFTFLAATGDMLNSYFLLHEGAGPKGSDVAKPAEILVDSEGIVRWVNLTRNATLRIRPEAVLAAWDELR